MSGISRREFAGLMALLPLAFARRLSPAWQPGPDDVALESDIMIPMEDGTLLATDVYRPARSGRPVTAAFPVLLERTPYGKTVTSRAELTARQPEPRSRAEVAAFFVRQGYVMVYQDCRGRYRSGGEFVKYLSDAADGRDTIAWIVRQPWCNGKVGTFGLSYAAHTQGALACLAPPGLAAMWLDSGGFSNAYQGGIRQGGAFELKQATWAYRSALESPEIARDPARHAALAAVDIRAWFERMPWKRGDSPLSLSPEYEDYLFEQWEHGVFDDYWKQPGIYAEGCYERYADVPMVHMSSWYDPYARTATDNFRGLSRRKTGPVRLIMGPWTHGNRSLSYAGDVDFGPAAVLDGNLGDDYFGLRLRWFDRWGGWAVFFGRMVPLVRTFVSYPAGISRMPMSRFLLFTTLGSVPWNLGLIYAGFLVGENYPVIEETIKPYEYVIYAVVIAVVVILAVRFWWGKRQGRGRGSVSEF